MKIGLLLIATNKYTQFLQPLISSADKFFLNALDVTYFIFTNQNFDIDSRRKYKIINVDHKPWPWMTLGRYEIFNDSKSDLSEMDYLYYCDVDMKFVGHVGDEILSDLVATQHPGYCGQRGTPENRPQSLAFVDKSESMQYFAGGFNGGSSSTYLKMSEIISKNIEEDFKNKIIAIWHDESHINRYLIDNPPTKILSPSYCYPESVNIPFEKRLLALNKNHSEIRK
jgi:histo-blood group ABO system transferase